MLYEAGTWDRGKLGFPVARVCCGWIFLLPFLCPPALPSCNSLFKETSLSCAELSTAAICRDTPRSSSTSPFTGWSVVGNGHSLHCQIASAPKVLPIEQTRVVSLLALHPYVCVYPDSHLLRKGPCSVFFHTAFDAVL